MKLSEAGIQADDYQKMYETMLMARRLDERVWLLNRAGKIPFNISGQGQEAAQVGAAFAFDLNKDYCLPYYRDLAVVLAFGMTPTEVMLSAYAKAEEPNSGGRQMPAHYSKRANRIVTQSSPVTTQYPHAAGIGLAAKMAHDPITVYVSIGEGSSNQGDFHEAMNFASVQKLPVVFVIHNNQYAISVPTSKQYAAETLADRAIGYGMPGQRVDGNNVGDVYYAVKGAVDRARNGEGPTLIETLSYRFTPHSSDDDDRLYRSLEEVNAAKKHDPLAIFETQLLDEALLSPEEINTIAQRVDEEVEAATAYAENAPYAAPESALHYVYEETGEGGQN